MTTLTKFLLALLLASLAWGGWNKIQALQARKKVESISTYVHDLENAVERLYASRRAIAKSLETLQRERDQLKKEHSDASNRLKGELDKAPDWAATPVPPGVRDSLRSSHP